MTSPRTRFRYCTSDGLLLYATGGLSHYLALGVQSSQLVLAFDMGNGIQEVSVHTAIHYIAQHITTVPNTTSHN